MTTLYCRGSIVGLTVVVALLATQPARAQSNNIGTNREPGGLENDLVTGVEYDRLNQVKALRRLDYLQAKLARDSSKGNKVAADRDLRKIDRDRYRIAVNCWLIKQNTLVDPGYYPVRTDPCSVEAIQQVASPSAPLPRQL